MTKEIKYQFIDKTGECFEKFQDMASENNSYNDTIGATLRASHHDDLTFSVGDMMVFKRDLLDAGFKWGIDFYVRKIV